MITDNILKLTSEEKNFIKMNSPMIDLNNLNLTAEGMSSITNIDLLESTMRYDFANKRFANDRQAEKIYNSLTGKINRYKGKRDKVNFPGFHVEDLCAKADQVSMMATENKIGNDLFRVDQAINYIRTVKNEYEIEEYIFSVAMCLGAKLGEIILDDSLYKLGFDWFRGEKNPILLNREDMKICDPIAFVYKKLIWDSSDEDKEGTCSDFYYRFLDTLDN